MLLSSLYLAGRRAAGPAVRVRRISTNPVPITVAHGDGIGPESE